MARYDVISCGCCRYYKIPKAANSDEFRKCELHDVVFKRGPSYKFTICKNWSLNDDIDIRDKSKIPPRESDQQTIWTTFPNLEEGILYIFEDPFYDLSKRSVLKPEIYARLSDLPKDQPA